jgi:hypothetical protein
MVHSGYEASAVDHCFGSIKGLLATAKATFFNRYRDDEALAALEEKSAPVSHVGLVQLNVPTPKPREAATNA